MISAIGSDVARPHPPPPSYETDGRGSGWFHSAEGGRDGKADCHYAGDARRCHRSRWRVWVQPDGDHGTYSFERQARSAGLVLGRKTYEGLAAYWPSQTGKWADMVNELPKYVGSKTLSGDLEWNATALGDVEDSIPRLKDDVDGDLFMHGSGEFAYALAHKGLIDEYEIYVNPLVWGEGHVHVLGDRGTIRLELEDVKRFDSGVVLLTYLPA